MINLRKKINLKKEDVKEKTIEERYEEHLRIMGDSACYGCEGCEFGYYGVCSTYEMNH